MEVLDPTGLPLVDGVSHPGDDQLMWQGKDRAAAKMPVDGNEIQPVPEREIVADSPRMTIGISRELDGLTGRQ
jgi:hypothetical protein